MTEFIVWCPDLGDLKASRISAYSAKEAAEQWAVYSAREVIDQAIQK